MLDMDGGFVECLPLWEPGVASVDKVFVSRGNSFGGGVRSCFADFIYHSGDGLGECLVFKAKEMIFFELFWTFFKIGLFSFGGGYANMITTQRAYSAAAKII